MPCVYGMIYNCLMFLMLIMHGVLTFVCHNELRDLTAAWLQVCYDVITLLLSLPYNPLVVNLRMSPNSTIHGDDAQADIHATVFGGR